MGDHAHQAAQGLDERVEPSGTHRALRGQDDATTHPPQKGIADHRVRDEAGHGPMGAHARTRDCRGEKRSDHRPSDGDLERHVSALTVTFSPSQ